MSQPLNTYNKQHRQSFSNMAANHVDAWAMLEAASRLNKARQEPIEKDEYRAALRLNWRMWTIIQAELTEENCPLPIEILQNLLSLSNFIDKQSVKALASLKGEDLDILITINREISAGLNADDDKPQTLSASGSESASDLVTKTIVPPNKT